MWPGVAWAHAFAERYDLPLPLGFYLAGAGLAVALSFLGSFLIRRPPRAESLSIGIPVPARVVSAARWMLRTAALLLLAAVVATGLAGPESPTRNFATIFVWVIWWVGFTLFTALVADLWTVANPFRSLVDFLLRASGLGRRARAVPAAAGWLPVLGLLLLSWLELVSDLSEDPRALAALAAVYLLFLLAGSAVAGTANWFSAADPLTRLFGLLGRAAPVAPARGGLRLRVPASGLVGVEAGAPGAVFAVALIAVVLFDGLAETPVWSAALDAVTQSRTLRPWLLDLRASGIDILKLIRTLGLLATVLAAVLLYSALTLAMWRMAESPLPWRQVFSGFAASLLPIAVAYHLAHYASYLALAGQLVVPAASDPFGLGWDLFGGAHRTIDLGAISAGEVWWIAAVALVSGHALSVFVAHAEALRLFSDRRRAIGSQVPMMVFMVALTSLSLWILAQPIVA
jgi:hypothetical protein